MTYPEKSIQTHRRFRPSSKKHVHTKISHKMSHEILTVKTFYTKRHKINKFDTSRISQVATGPTKTKHNEHRIIGAHSAAAISFSQGRRKPLKEQTLARYQISTMVGFVQPLATECAPCLQRWTALENARNSSPF